MFTLAKSDQRAVKRQFSRDNLVLFFYILTILSIAYQPFAQGLTVLRKVAKACEGASGYLTTALHRQIAGDLVG